MKRVASRFCIVMCLAVFLSGCGTTGQALNCAGWKAIRPSRHDVLTRGTKEQILAHNEQGVAQKCWPEP